PGAPEQIFGALRRLSLTATRPITMQGVAYAVRKQPFRRRGGRVAEGGGLLNRYRALKLYRGFESHPLRQYFRKLPSPISKMALQAQEIEGQCSRPLYSSVELRKIRILFGRLFLLNSVPTGHRIQL